MSAVDLLLLFLAGAEVLASVLTLCVTTNRGERPRS